MEIESKATESVHQYKLTTKSSSLPEILIPNEDNLLSTVLAGGYP